MEITSVNYKEWRNCLLLSTAYIKLVVAKDFGPRVLHFSTSNGENVFASCSGAGRETPFGYWQIYGGHRLWVAPEVYPATYHPDNDPVAVKEIPGGISLTGTLEEGTGLQKVIEIKVAQEKGSVQIRHRIRNLSGKPVELAPWALSVMAPGGTAVVPLRPSDADPEGSQPSHTVSIWPFSNPADPRWHWRRDHLLVHQDPENSTPQKVGVTGQEGWAAYVRSGIGFLKKYGYEVGQQYPDGNVSLEIYTDDRFLEVESLGPIQVVLSGEEAVFDEQWWLLGDLPSPKNDLGKLTDFVRDMRS